MSKILQSLPGISKFFLVFDWFSEQIVWVELENKVVIIVFDVVEANLDCPVLTAGDVDDPFFIIFLL